MVQQYLDHCKAIITNSRSNFKGGSKESGLISLFGYQNEYDLREGFPLLTTKEMRIDSIIHELVWFLKGGTNIKYLEDNKCSIWRADTFQHNLPGMIKEGIFHSDMKKYSPDWDKAMKDYGQMIRENPQFAERWGEAGPIYGKQWRKWSYNDKETGKQKELDQLGRVLNNMRKNPSGKKHLVSAWNPVDVPEMSLPPCHVMYQMTVNEQGELELQLYQRSCDEFLGVPFNIASYAMLTTIIAQELGFVPKTFIHTFGDAHFYTGPEKRAQWYKENFKELQKGVNFAIQEEKMGDGKECYSKVLNWVDKNAPENGLDEKYDHVTAVLEQLSREPRPLPKLTIAKKPFDKLEFSDFVISEYNPHPAINRKMSV
jgi:thymidylate synthase